MLLKKGKLYQLKQSINVFSDINFTKFLGILSTYEAFTFLEIKYDRRDLLSAEFMFNPNSKKLIKILFKDNIGYIKLAKSNNIIKVTE